jgi:dihydroorotase (multifunctional complex type)
MSSLVLKNARFMLPEKVFEGDLMVVDESISKMGKDLQGDEEIDLQGKYVLPGLVDAHVHFREPGASEKEDWFTGSCAAAAGGVTTVLDMPNTSPPTTTKKLLDEKRKNYAYKSTVDYGFHFGASTGNMEELRKIDEIASVKFYMGSTTGSLLVESDLILLDQLRVLSERDILATVHAEDERVIEGQTKKLMAACRKDAGAYAESRPNKAAAEAAKRVITLSGKAKSRLHICHISTKEELEILSTYKKDQAVTCEASPHHLFLTKDDYERLGTLAKTNPPLRSKKDREALWAAVKNGQVDIIATDHAPHTLESKKQDIWTAPAGVPGLETMLPLLLNEVNKGTLSLKQVIGLTSENPARIFRIRNKGRIKEGYDADLVVVDTDLEKKVSNEELYTKCGWSPFSGWKLKGWPVKTFVRGKLVYDEGKIDKIKGKEVSYV